MPGSFSGWYGLPPGATLNPGEWVQSRSGEYRLTMQADGNLVATNGDGVGYWASHTDGRPGSVLTMGSDGNLVVHNLDGAVGWHAATFGHPGASLVLNDDGNMVVVGTDGSPLWNLWQANADSGTSFGKTLSRAARTVGSAAGVAADVWHDVAKITRVVAPVLTSILVASGVGLPVAAAVGSVGAEIVASDAAITAVRSALAAAESGNFDVGGGFDAAVGVLNDPDVTPDQIAQVRDALPSDDDRAAFDAALAHASDLAPTSSAIAAANQVVRLQNVGAFRIAPQPPSLAGIRSAPAKVVPIGRLNVAPPAAKPGTATILDVIAKERAILGPAAPIGRPALPMAGRLPLPTASRPPSSPEELTTSGASKAPLLALLAAGIAAAVLFRR